ncbi:MAG TPA: FliM/FliN family flagellar motor switch protein [Terriglobales bacterium]|nr:FliM/FliN family flagellar motor switch protein [Terriglobales bacterium]
MVEKVLNQEQIDAMVRAAREGKAAKPGARQKSISGWDARQAGQIGREQMSAISTLHEAFARNLTHSLGAYLRIVFDAALVSAEHLTFVEFLQRVPEVTYLATVKLEPAGAMALLQLDLPVVFPLIDVLLGGQGTALPTGHEITEIEEQILETVMTIICRELQSTWQVLALQFIFDQRQLPQQVQYIMPGEEKTLCLSFEITLADSRGNLNLMVPAVVSNALLRKLAAGWAAAKSRPRSDSGQQLRKLLLKCPFRVELSMNSSAVTLGQLVNLSAGDLLVLRRSAAKPAVLSVGEHDLFYAAVARCGTRRAAKLLERKINLDAGPAKERKLPK